MGSIPLVTGAVRKTGDGEIPRSNRLRDAGGLIVAVMARKQVRIMQQAAAKSNPVQGARAYGSFNLAPVGSLHLATGGAGRTTSGDRTKKPAMKSSTMNGVKALGSKLCVETAPNREKLSLAGKGTLLVSCPRNRRLGLRKLCPAGRLGHRAMVRRLVLLATSPTWQTASLIREGPPLPRVVARCLVGNQVFEKQRTGRVVQVEAVVWSFQGPRASSRQGSRALVPASGWHRKRRGRRKSGRGKPDIDNVHYWLTVMLPGKGVSVVI